jgi:hypothetical protein
LACCQLVQIRPGNGAWGKNQNQVPAATPGGEEDMNYIGKTTESLIKDKGCKLIVSYAYGLGWDARIKYAYPDGYDTLTDGQGRTLEEALNELEAAASEMMSDNSTRFSA